MRVAGEGFRPGRLRQAREARGGTQTSLARVVDLSPQSVSLYERGAARPGPETLERIAQSLGVPFGFFFEPEVDFSPATTHYRSLSAATKTARLSCERQYEWVVEIVLYLQRFVRLPEFDVPSVETAASAVGISPSAIEEAAERCRRGWGLGTGPISNLIWLLENHGCIVTRFAFGADTLDALSRWNAELERGFLLLNSDKQSAARSRFDAAHELAHLVLHRHLGSDQATRLETWKLLEGQAHRFSGAFLLPAASFIEDFMAGGTIDHYLRLKAKWGCSLAMMFHRARALQIIDDSDYRRLAILLGRRGWRRHEPLDDSIRPEMPQLLARSFELIVERGVRSAATIRQELPLAMSDVAELACLKPEILSERPPTGEIIDLSRWSGEMAPKANEHPGSIVPFKRGPASDGNQ